MDLARYPNAFEDADSGVHVLEDLEDVQGADLGAPGGVLRRFSLRDEHRWVVQA